jgi:hypothetical protein
MILYLDASALEKRYLRPAVVGGDRTDWVSAPPG